MPNPLSATEKKEVVASGSAELFEFFQQLQTRDARNSHCIDCNKAIDMEMEEGWGMWGSVNNGCFFCMNCSGRHRSIGVHLSFARSTVQDNWKREQLRSMEMGGNNKLLDFWKENGVDCTLAITEKYQLLPSIAYRLILKARTDDLEPVSVEAALAAAEWMTGPGKWDNQAALQMAIAQTKTSAAAKSAQQSPAADRRRWPVHGNSPSSAAKAKVAKTAKAANTSKVRTAAAAQVAAAAQAKLDAAAEALQATVRSSCAVRSNQLHSEVKQLIALRERQMSPLSNSKPRAVSPVSTPEALEVAALLPLSRGGVSYGSCDEPGRSDRDETQYGVMHELYGVASFGLQLLMDCLHCRLCVRDR